VATLRAVPYGGPVQDLLLPTAIAFVLHAAVVVAIGLRVVMARPVPGVALSWIMLVAALPLAGGLCYVAFGERRIGSHRQARFQLLREPRQKYLRDMLRLPASRVAWEGLPDTAAVMDQLGQANLGQPSLAGNNLELLEGAETVLRSILADVEGARRTLQLQFYIWHPGGLADEVAAAVERAAARGVVCRVLVDAIGSSRWLRSEWPDRLRGAGAAVVAALPAGLMRGLLRRSDLRNHRKIVVVDGTTAYTGSMNMVDPHFFKQGAGVGQWVDAMVRVRGPVVAGLLGVFLGDWFLETHSSTEELITQSDLEAVQPAGGAVVQVVSSGPARGGDGIVQMLLTMLFAARRRVVITTPYFVPDDALLRALRSAALRGVEVVLIVPEKVDSLLVRHASRSYFEDLMDAGVRIHCYRGGLLHTKSVVVDERIALFGTHNLDIRSLWLNFEVSLCVYDEAFGKQLDSLQQSYLRDCVALEPQGWRERPFARRAMENVVRLFSPLL